MALTIASAGAVALASTPQNGGLSGANSPVWVKDGGWQEVGMVGLHGPDSGAIRAVDRDGGSGFAGAIGHGSGTRRAKLLPKEKRR